MGVEKYLKKVSWEVKENANLSYSISSIFFKLAGDELKRYILRKVYPTRIAKAHREGDFHIHNLYMGMSGYCAGWSVRDLLLKGFGYVPGKVSSLPAKHLSTALLQLTNFVGTLQNEWAGAQAFNDLDVYLAPFIRKDKLTYKEVKQQMQQFIYNLNISSRWGGQTPFTNITFDLEVPKDLKNEQVICKGKILKDTYSAYLDEIETLNKAFLEALFEGDASQRIFTFPIPTYNLTKNFNWESEIGNILFELTGKYGSPYFQNFLKIERDPTEIRSMCCRLRLDMEEIYRRLGGYFGYGDKTGSIGVVTINLPRIGFLTKSENEFFEKLENLLQLAKQSLEIKRELVKKNIKNELLPFTEKYLGTLRFHFSTIGLVGMNEACINFLSEPITSKAGLNFARKTIKFIRKKLIEFQRETGNIFNLEETPAESTSYRLALKDRKKYPKIKTAGKKTPYYTNSTHPPVTYSSDIFEYLKHQEKLQPLYNGGTVFHAWVGEKLELEECKLLVKKISKGFRIPYFTITPTFSICEEHGYIKGRVQYCRSCRRKTEIYSRIVGYYRPLRNWNKGKRKEFYERKLFKPLHSK